LLFGTFYLHQTFNFIGNTGNLSEIELRCFVITLLQNSKCPIYPIIASFAQFEYQTEFRISSLFGRLSAVIRHIRHITAICQLSLFINNYCTQCTHFTSLYTHCGQLRQFWINYEPIEPIMSQLNSTLTDSIFQTW